MASLFHRLQAWRPHPRPLFRRRQPLRHLLAGVLAGALWTLALPVTASEPVPGHSLESIRAWVLEHNPELRAMDFEAQAAEARIQPAGALPDPTASLGFRGLDPDKPWRSAGADRQVDYALRQRFPLRLTRGTKVLAFHPVKCFRCREEPESAPVANDDTRRLRLDLDDVGIRHFNSPAPELHA
jgi:hypothetical protein